MQYMALPSVPLGGLFSLLVGLFIGLAICGLLRRLGRLSNDPLGAQLEARHQAVEPFTGDFAATAQSEDSRVDGRRKEWRGLCRFRLRPWRLFTRCRRWLGGDLRQVMRVVIGRGGPRNSGMRAAGGGGGGKAAPGLSRLRGIGRSKASMGTAAAPAPRGGGTRGTLGTATWEGRTGGPAGAGSPPAGGSGVAGDAAETPGTGVGVGSGAEAGRAKGSGRCRPSSWGSPQRLQ